MSHLISSENFFNQKSHLGNILRNLQPPPPMGSRPKGRPLFSDSDEDEDDPEDPSFSPTSTSSTPDKGKSIVVQPKSRFSKKRKYVEGSGGKQSEDSQWKTKYLEMKHKYEQAALTVKNFVKFYADNSKGYCSIRGGEPEQRVQRKRKRLPRFKKQYSQSFTQRKKQKQRAVLATGESKSICTTYLESKYSTNATNSNYFRNRNFIY